MTAFRGVFVVDKNGLFCQWIPAVGFTCLFGRNGTGKTVTLRTVAAAIEAVRTRREDGSQALDVAVVFEDEDIASEIKSVLFQEPFSNESLERACKRLLEADGPYLRYLGIDEASAIAAARSPLVALTPTDITLAVDSSQLNLDSNLRDREQDDFTDHNFQADLVRATSPLTFARLVGAQRPGAVVPLLSIGQRRGLIPQIEQRLLDRLPEPIRIDAYHHAHLVGLLRRCFPHGNALEVIQRYFLPEGEQRPLWLSDLTGPLPPAYGGDAARFASEASGTRWWANQLVPPFLDGEISVEFADLVDAANGDEPLVVGLAREDGVTTLERLSDGEQRWVAAALVVAARDVLELPWPAPPWSAHEEDEALGDPSSEESEASQESSWSLEAALQELKDPLHNVLWLMDEPELHLHPLAIAEAADWLGQLAARSTGVLVATHSPRFISARRNEDDLASGVTRPAVGTLLIASKRTLPQFDYVDNPETGEYFENTYWRRDHVIEAVTEGFAATLDKRSSELGCGRGDALLSYQHCLVVEGENDRHLINFWFATELEQNDVLVIDVGGHVQLSLANLQVAALLPARMYILLDAVSESFADAMNDAFIHGTEPPRARTHEEGSLSRIWQNLPPERQPKVLPFELPDILFAIDEEDLRQVLGPKAFRFSSRANLLESYQRWRDGLRPSKKKPGLDEFFRSELTISKAMLSREVRLLREARALRRPSRELRAALRALLGSADSG